MGLQSDSDSMAQNGDVLWNLCAASLVSGDGVASDAELARRLDLGETEALTPREE